MTLTLIDAQLLQIFGQVLYRHAEIVSGAYKQATTQQACGTNKDRTFKWRDLTDDEKLANSLSIMKAQLHRLMDLEDHISQSTK